MFNRLKQIPSFLRGELIVLKVDTKKEKLTVDAGNSNAEDLKKAANSLFKTAHNLNMSSLSKVAN